MFPSLGRVTIVPWLLGCLGTMCGCFHWLEVCQLLQSETQVVYPKGLNRCLVLVVTPLPESLAHDTNALDDEPTFLQVDLSQFTAGDHESKALVPGRTSTCTSPMHLALEHPPKAESQASMTAEVQDLLLHAVWDTSNQVLGNSNQKGQHLRPWGLHPLLEWKTFPNWLLPPLRHHCRWPCLMSPSQLTKLKKQSTLPLPLWPRFLGLTQVSSWRMWCYSKRKWTKLWGAYWQLGNL